MQGRSAQWTGTRQNGSEMLHALGYHRPNEQAIALTSTWAVETGMLLETLKSPEPRPS